MKNQVEISVGSGYKIGTLKECFGIDFSIEINKWIFWRHYSQIKIEKINNHLCPLIHSLRLLQAGNCH